MAWQVYTDTDDHRTAGVVAWLGMAGGGAKPFAPDAITSTCAVLLEERASGTPTYRLRMYNVDAGDLARLPDAEEFEYDGNLQEPVLRGGAAVDSYIGYIDATAEWSHAFTSADLWFDLLPTADRGPEYLVQSTRVPAFRILDGVWHPYNYNADNDRTTHRGSTAIEYGGPHVIQLPNGKWLMLLSRMMVPDAGSREEYTSARSSNNPERPFDDPQVTFHDVIGYLADDATFTSVVGPLWIVDSRDAWRDPDHPGTPLEFEGSPMRLRAGVPGAVVIGDYLYVYYALHASDFFGKNGDATADSTGYSAALSDLGFSAGLGVKRISLIELDSPTVYDEGSWDELKYPEHAPEVTEGLDCTVRGELLGLVRVWVYQGEGDSGPEVKAFADYQYEEFVAFSAFTDPAPVLCDGRLYLYTPASPSGLNRLPGQGHGLWRLQGMRDGDRYETLGAAASATLGVDFIVYPSDHIADIIPITEELFSQWLNPDPILLPDHTWRIYCGGQAGWINVIVGSHADGCEARHADPKVGSFRRGQELPKVEPREWRLAALPEQWGFAPPDLIEPYPWELIPPDIIRCPIVDFDILRNSDSPTGVIEGFRSWFPIFSNQGVLSGRYQSLGHALLLHAAPIVNVLEIELRLESWASTSKLAGQAAAAARLARYQPRTR